MEPIRNDTAVQESSISTNCDRCRKVTAILCIVISTVVFFGSATAIVWLFKNKLPYKYSVICFMVGSGVLYVVAFASNLLLLTRKIPKRSRAISRPQPHLGLTDCVPNQEGCETASDISYRQGTHLLPQRVNSIITPNPAYIEPSGISTSQKEVGQAQSTQDSNPGISLNRFYYELNRDYVQESELVQRPLQQELTASGLNIEMQTMLTSRSITGNSNPITYALKQQMASNSQLPLQSHGETSRGALQDPIGKSGHRESTSSESSPRSALKMKRNPSQVVKQKLKAKLFVSQPDLLSEGSQNSNLNTKIRVSHSNLNPDGRSSLPDCSGDLNSSRLNLNPHVTPRIPGSNPEAQTSLSNLSPLGTPRVIRSYDELRISQSNLSPEERLQASQLDCNERMKESQLSLRPEGTPQIARSNIGRTSQMNLIPVARFLTSLSTLKLDRERPSSNLNPESRKIESLSNLASEQKQFDSKLNYLVSSGRRFNSHSNLHLNSQQSKSNANSYGLERAPQADTDSNASHDIARANMDSGRQTSSLPVKHFQKMSQPQQFVACSENMPNLQRAQSLAALSATNPLTLTQQLPLKTVPKTIYEPLPEYASSTRKMSGRSIESALDAPRNYKQMTPEEWIVAWNHGFHKLPTEEAEKIVGVRL